MEIIEASRDYIKTYTYNKIHAKIMSYLKKNINFLSNEWDLPCSFENLKIIDICFKTIFFYDMPGTKFRVSILIEIAINVNHYGLDDDKEIKKNIPFQVIGSMDVNRKGKGFVILSLKKLDSITKFPRQLTNSLCPIIHKSDYEKEATAFLSKYYPEALKQLTIVDPMVIVNRMGLKYIEASITANHSVFGQTHFTTHKAKLYDEKNGIFYERKIRKGSIVIDSDAFPLLNNGSKNNTIIHECIHWWKHRKAMHLQYLFNKNATTIECSVNVLNTDTTIIDQRFMEIHANALAPRILMPYAMFKKYAQETIASLISKNPGINEVDIMESVINICAQMFGVSKLSAKIRLVEVGFKTAAGTYIYVDNHYVRPYAFADKTLKFDETFTIPTIDAFLLSLNNQQIKSWLEKGIIIFAENHYVINDNVAIIKDSQGKVILSEEARLNMDKYCLIFKMKPLNTKIKSNDCFLNRDRNTNINFHIEFPKRDGKEMTAAEKAAIIIETEKEQSKISFSLPRTYSGCLHVLMKNKKMTATDIAAAAGIDDRLVRRMINGERYGSLAVLIMILHILGCNADSALYIIDLSPFKANTDQDVYYLCRFIAMNISCFSYIEVVELIKGAEKYISKKDFPKFSS